MRRALGLFALQFALNVAWSPVFFGAHAVGAALVILILLWVVLFMTLLAFYRLDRPAAALLLPYHL